MKKIWNTALPLCIRLGLGILSPLVHAEGLLAVNNPAKNGLETGAYASAEVFEGNDQIAMAQYGNDWRGDYSPRSGQNLGLLAARGDVGAQWNGYRLGALYRAEALVQANRDTSDLVRQYSSNSGYDAGRSYQIGYQINGFEADGVRLSKSFQQNLNLNWQVSWGAGASLLRGKQVKVETASGQVTTLNAKDFNANVAQTSTDSTLDTSGTGKFNSPYGVRPSVSGQGYALDLGVVLLRQDGLRLEAAVNDLAGRMAWKNLPEYAANYASAIKYYDANGYVRFNPTATAQSSYRDLTQTLDPKVWLAVGYPLGGFELQAASSYTQGFWFPEAGVAYQLNPQWRLNADFDFRFNTVSMSVHHQWFYLALRTQSSDFDQSKAYGVSGGLNIRF